MKTLTRHAVIALSLALVVAACTPAQMGVWMKRNGVQVSTDRDELVEQAAWAAQVWDGLFERIQTEHEAHKIARYVAGVEEAEARAAARAAEAQAEADAAAAAEAAVQAAPPPPPPPPAPTPVASGGWPWDQLVQCEAGGNWHINTGNGFSGGLQFHPGTWNAFGGQQYAPMAYQATPAQQIDIASRVVAAAGGTYRDWPACRAKLGLP